MKDYKGHAIKRATIGGGMIRFYAIVNGERIQRIYLDELKAAIDEKLK